MGTYAASDLSFAEREIREIRSLLGDSPRLAAWGRSYGSNFPLSAETPLLLITRTDAIFVRNTPSSAILTFW